MVLMNGFLLKKIRSHGFRVFTMCKPSILLFVFNIKYKLNKSLLLSFGRSAASHFNRSLWWGAHPLKRSV